MTDLIARLAIAESRIEGYSAKIAELEDEVEGLEKEVHDMREDSLRRENRRLIWGIGALGTVVMTLAGVIWRYVVAKN